MPGCGLTATPVRSLQSELNKQQVGVIPIHVDPDSQTNTLHNLTYHVEVVLPTVAPTVRVFVVCASSTTTAAVLKQVNEHEMWTLQIYKFCLGILLHNTCAKFYFEKFFHETWK